MDDVTWDRSEGEGRVFYWRAVANCKCCCCARLFCSECQIYRESRNKCAAGHVTRS